MIINVYKNEYGYSTLAKNKDKKMYISVNFKKGIEPQNDYTRLRINDGFFSLYEDKNKLPKVKLIILNYEEVENINEDDINYSYDDDLPF